MNIKINNQIIVVCLLLFSIDAFADKIVIAALAFSGEAYAQKSWQPTIDYLQQHIPEHSFKLISIEPSNVKTLENLVANQQIDFVITQPISYVDLEVLYGAISILTLVDKSKYAQFGSVIFTHLEKPIYTLKDVQNRVIAGATPKGLGGWLIGYNTFLEAGFNLHKDAKQVRFLGVQDNIVKAVLTQEVDIGIVRTGVLERMMNDNEQIAEKIRIIHPQTQPNFPYYLSSELYPEWAFAKTKKVSNKLAKQVASILLSMPENSPAAKARGYWEWITPIDYQPIHSLMKKLKIGAYHHHDKVSFMQYTKQNVLQVILVIVLLLVLIIASAWIFKLNRGLKKSQYSLQKRHDLMLNSVYDGIYGVDLSGKCTFINKAMTDITGWQADDMIGKQQHPILHHSHGDGAHYAIDKCPVYQTILDGKNRFIEDDVFWKKSGQSFAVEYSCTAIKDKSGRITGSVVVFRDMSEKYKTQQILQKYQSDLFHMARINTLGEMVSGIAHELNQPLTTINTSAFVAKQLLNSPKINREKLLETTHLISTQAERSGKIIKQLRLLIKKESSQRLLVNINNLIEDVLKIIQIEANKLSVRIDCYFEKNIPKISVEPIQIDQVILNLCKNAIEALQLTPIGQRQLTISTKIVNDVIVVNIKDNAKGGVNTQIIDTLFNPFISSKQQGIGLGLSISKEIISAHNGHLYLKSSDNQGSEFELTLPILNND